MLRSLRRRLISDPLYAWAQRNLPPLSAAEREALEAAGAWWERDLASGDPGWHKLLAFAPPGLSNEEEAFLAGPVNDLCAKLDDWRLTTEWHDLPDDAWAFLKRHKFFGLTIPKTHGGLGFSACAYSEIVKRIATRSVAAAITVMIPNSFGPGELLLQFGTDAQKRHYLPRLADGREIPCFALTSREPGSHRFAQIDRGVVGYGEHEGRQVPGIRVSWSKRDVALAPVATLLCVAFKLFDPEHLLGEKEDLGITLALFPASARGVEIGRRHWPAMQALQHGPIEGRDVFIPLDAVIGGPDCIGAGWRMLVRAHAAGRGISLPSLATGVTCLAARTSGAYARIRAKVGVPRAIFDGVQERLGRLAGIAYELEAARRFTCVGFDLERRPAVIAAILKADVADRVRVAINDALDVHGSKAVMDGPRNYLGNVYRAIPICTTDEGADDLARKLFTFGQGALHCHPYLRDELHALDAPDAAGARAHFDRALWGHVRHFFASFGRALARTWSGAWFAPAPAVGPMRSYRRTFQRLGRYAAAFAFASEVELVTVVASRKRSESAATRLGDVLSELYFLSSVLKRHADELALEEDRPLVQWCCETGFARIEAALDGLIRNFPVRPLAWLLRAVTLPFGVSCRDPADQVTRACAELLMQRGEARDRLTFGIYVGLEYDGPGRVEHAFALVDEAAPTLAKARDAGFGDDWAGALAAGVLTGSEAEVLAETDVAVRAALDVDDFAPHELASLRTGRNAEAAVPRDRPLRNVA